MNQIYIRIEDKVYPLNEPKEHPKYKSYSASYIRYLRSSNLKIEDEWVKIGNKYFFYRLDEGLTVALE